MALWPVFFAFGVALLCLLFLHWKKLDLHGPVLFWFDLSVHFLNDTALSSVCSLPVNGYISSNICQSHDFGVVCGNLLNTDMACLSAYMDESLISLGTVNMKAGVAVFFEDIGSDLGVEVSGLVFSILTELQTALDACKSESLLHADALAKDAAFLPWRLSYLISECFLRAGSVVVSGNSRHFVHDVFQSINCAHWKVGSGSKVVADNLYGNIDWSRSSLVWHPDFHMATGFTSIQMAGFRTYFMKALHHRLPVAVQKRLYNRGYSSVVCLFCDEIEVSDHVFSCSSDADSCTSLLDTYAAAWEVHSGLSHSSSCILQLLSTCISYVTVSTVLCKSFVFSDWYHKSVSVYKDPKMAVVNVVNFVCEFCLAFCDNIWLVHVKHQAIMEKNKLIPHDSSIPVAVSGFSMWLSAGVIRLLDVADALGISFGYHKLCLFYADVGDMASVHISA
ncbi:hypothetical protein G9A89_021557 [Geosiphon pyriformis]|nr:hypothetical protein G9A89_021557 [Geosiphon pyriformis]